MMPNKTYELRKLFIEQGRYAVEPAETSYDQPSLLRWPSNGYFGRLVPDAELLQDAVRPYPINHTYPIADQVFGQHVKGQQVNLQHLSNLFYERCRLHQRHTQDIDEHHLKIQGRLFGAEINYTPDRSRQIRTLEGQLMQLEQQRREEELAFWKDTVELREKLFEGASTYREAKHRMSVVSDTEEDDG